MKFKKMNKAFEFETKKGKLTIENTEYFQIDDNRANAPVVINKEGMQKIEQFFGVKYLEPKVDQVWHSPSNFNVIVTIGIEHDGDYYYGIGSGSPLNLNGVISQAYPVDLAIKRAKCVAALDLLRRNYTGSERLPLLYSDFAEFNAINAVNTTVDVVEEKSETTTKTVKNEPVKEKIETVQIEKVEIVTAAETKVETVSNQTANKGIEQHTAEAEAAEETQETVELDIEDFVLETSKYRNGITIKELHESNPSYLNWLATTQVSGKYINYQEKVKEYIAKHDVKFA